MGDCMSVDGQLLADGDMRSACKGGLRGAFRRCLQMELTWSKCTQCAIRERESVAHYGDGISQDGRHTTRCGKDDWHGFRVLLRWSVYRIVCVVRLKGRARQ